MVYNHFLAHKKEKWEKEKIGVSYLACSRQLTGLKNELSWLKEVSSVALQQTLRHLDKAFSNFFKKKARYPRFKKKYDAQKAMYMKTSFTYKNGQIYLAKCKEPLPIRWSRVFQGKPTSITITKESSGRYFISILVKEEVKPLPFKPQAIGLDLGLSVFATDHQGKEILNPKFLEKDFKRLRRKSQALSRKKKGSQNRRKARQVVAQLHSHIRNKRNDFLHKLSSQLISENQVIATEDLGVKNMQKDPRYARSISSVGWGSFLKFLKYKCSWYGKEFVQIGRFFPSSKQCFSCNHIYKELKRDEREWECPCCKDFHNRDHNAARNILLEGLRVVLEKLVPWDTRDLSLWSLCKTIQENLKGNGQRIRNLTCEG
jgi:putative transposase